mmetsp:Transcript_13498/g.31762  ORF Transcript_13498/g.31762 Transcript_13498/m.31762 type:complete len:136 (-) Transcript_13498:118-525(-)|eukprot:CAMPEP_0178425874 /NCGR_PEP_ID=MMETSP0689_2-20121128/28947_1 /TAXON_ID=160604 /ORGANISM="Amphidinium massartii, Strain CS-259" /LENGTH=135 /DNA_ID=CAMNT_0020047549 /DNA_START=55 /DNA_END=462 /DNA_ORIENTATION=+
MPDDGTGSKMSKGSWRDALPPDAPDDEEILEEIRKSKGLGEKETGAVWLSGTNSGHVDAIEPTASRSSRKSTGSRVSEGVRKVTQGISNMIQCSKKIGQNPEANEDDGMYGTGSLKLQSAIVDKEKVSKKPSLGK